MSALATEGEPSADAPRQPTRYSPLCRATNLTRRIEEVPNARKACGLFVDSDDAKRILLVVFDGDRLNAYQYDANVRQFVAANPRDCKHRLALRAMFREVFAPEDAYWSYALVTHAGFFGYKAPRPDSNKLRPPDTVADLYAMWNRAAVSE